MLRVLYRSICNNHKCLYSSQNAGVTRSLAYQNFDSKYNYNDSPSFRRPLRNKYDNRSSGGYRNRNLDSLRSDQRSGVGGLIDADQWSKAVEERRAVERVFGQRRPSANSEIATAYEENSGKMVRNNAPAGAEAAPVYAPLPSFKGLEGLDARLAANLARLGYDSTTPVQGLALPAIMNGEDLLALAQTGSGKTIAFLLPLVQHLLAAYPTQAMRLLAEHKGHMQFPSGLIVAPTRELVQQIASEAHKLTFGTPLRVVELYGGASAQRQAQELARGAHVVAATPGRLLDFLEQELVSLQACRHLVLDEADRCFDMGFEPQIRKLLSAESFGMPAQPPRGRRQTLLFSATFAADVRHLANEFMSAEHVQLTVGAPGQVPRTIKHEFVDLSAARRWPRSSVEGADDNEVAAAPQEERGFVSVHQLRYQALAALLAEEGMEQQPPANGAWRQAAPSANQVLVFCQTKHQCDDLEYKLRRNGFGATAIHGDKSQRQRNEALYNFKQGRCPILIASDVAARGLDIPNVSLVINYEMPATIDSYTHRIGRTGRLGRQGRAVTLLSMTGADASSLKNCQDDLCAMLRTAGHSIPQLLQSRISHSSKHARRSRSAGSVGGGYRARFGGERGGGSRPRFYQTDYDSTGGGYHKSRATGRQRYDHNEDGSNYSHGYRKGSDRW